MASQSTGNVNLKVYIYRVLKQVHPDSGSSAMAARVQNDMLNHLGKKIAWQAAEMTSSAINGQERKTIKAKDVERGVMFSLPGEIAKHAVSEGNKALAKYSKATGTESGSTTTAIKSGLQFSPSRCGRFFNLYKKRVGMGAKVYLAAVLEYISSEISELAGNIARDHKKVQITPRHIMMAVRNDVEINEAFDGHFSQSGVIEHVNAALTKKNSKKKRSKKSEGAEKKPHKFLPGTVALRDIKKYQKARTLLIRKAPFIKIVKHGVLEILRTDRDTGASGSLGEKFRFQKDAMFRLQTAVEAVIVDLAGVANRIAIHADRTTVKASDFKLALSLTHKHTVSYGNVRSQEMQGVTKPSVIRMFRRAGVKRINEEVYASVRDTISHMVTRLMYFVIHITSGAGRKTVTNNDVETALFLSGYPVVYGGLSDLTKSSKNKNRAETAKRVASKKASTSASRKTSSKSRKSPAKKARKSPAKK